MASLKQFYSDRYLHIRSFSLSFVTALLVMSALIALRPAEFYQYEFASWHLLLIPLGIYLGGISAVFIHNATHNSFPNKFLNEACGHLAGIHQLWGYNGWKLIHLLHHHYSDRDGMDPHPPKGKSFTQFLLRMFIDSSASVSARYREHWGESRKTYLLHKGVMLTSIGMGICHLAIWFLLLGPAGFLFGYIPSFIANHLLFAHINYYAHPVNAQTGETQATNMNHNLYYKLANAMWCGIYFHGNHHRKPLLFNPRKMVEKKREPRTAQAADAPALANTQNPKEFQEEYA